MVFNVTFNNISVISWLSTTYLDVQKCYGLGKKTLFKKQLFDLDVKGQGPMKVIMVCDTLPWLSFRLNLLLWKHLANWNQTWHDINGFLQKLLLLFQKRAFPYYIWIGCSLNWYTQLCICKYQQLKHLYCSIHHYG
jgi:hypothetical protein